MTPDNQFISFCFLSLPYITLHSGWAALGRLPHAEAIYFVVSRRRNSHYDMILKFRITGKYVSANGWAYS